MCKVRTIAEPFVCGVLCFFLSIAMIRFLRFEGNLAAIWPVNAVILAQLLRREPGDWFRFVVAGFVGVMASAVVLGGDLLVGTAFCILNTIEILVAAWLLRGSVDAQDRLLHHHASVGRFVLYAGIAAPACSAILAAIVAHFTTGLSFGLSLVTKFCADALGLLIFTPFFFTLFNGTMFATFRGLTWRERMVRIWLQTFVLASAGGVFWQEGYPLLFLPLAPLMLVAFRSGWQGTIVGVLIVAVSGGVATLLGHGPINPLPVGIAVKMTFLQFYLAVILGLMMPVAAALAGRRDLISGLRKNEQAMAMLTERASIVLLRFDRDGTCLRAVGNTQALISQEPGSLVGHRLERLDTDLAAGLIVAHRTALDQGPDGSCTVELERTGGSWIEATFRVEQEEPGKAGTVAILLDVTARKMREGELARLAETDELTGLANRAGFLRQFQAALDQGEELSIALIDVDRFKSLNDEYGHLAGDEVLAEVGRRLAQSIRSSDMVARLGGDEFVVMLRTADGALAHDICARIVKGVSRSPIALPLGGETNAYVSCGLARGMPGNGSTDYLSRADSALYEAKRLGRNQLIAA